MHWFNIYWATSSVRPLKENMSHSTAAGKNYGIGNDWLSLELTHLWAQLNPKEIQASPFSIIIINYLSASCLSWNRTWLSHCTVRWAKQGAVQTITHPAGLWLHTQMYLWYHKVLLSCSPEGSSCLNSTKHNCKSVEHELWGLLYVNGFHKMCP